jgi:hypothetical protein
MSVALIVFPFQPAVDDMVTGHQPLTLSEVKGKSPGPVISLEVRRHKSVEHGLSLSRS